MEHSLEARCQCMSATSSCRGGTPIPLRGGVGVVKCRKSLGAVEEKSATLLLGQGLCVTFPSAYYPVRLGFTRYPPGSLRSADGPTTIVADVGPGNRAWVPLTKPDDAGESTAQLCWNLRTPLRLQDDLRIFFHRVGCYGTWKTWSIKLAAGDETSG
ncbi:unnamed protein product [Trypanosoma congolense IL3000]|uniref:WGS project CAEQ00000000 data, annotated contig 1468 n=1 Tax=Trypanosoma congolense (strain IL3000) TaxID=1068625 RepID=F9W6H3_TRYCI|nr:unnamed protein product [Trypanosoma congolense IL3000]